MHTFVGLRFLGGLGLFTAAVALVLSGTTVSAIELSRESIEFQDQLDRMRDYFDANPELKQRKGSGWKPYNRLKWFNEQRMVNGELPAHGARWAVWERKRELEQHAGIGPRATWFELGPMNFSGRMLSVAFHPTDLNTVYAGSAGGGLWKTTDAGVSWVPLTDELPSLAVGGVAVSPLDPNIVVIGTGEPTNNIDRITGVGILRSTDAGLTWETTSLTLTQPSGSGFHVMTAGPNGTFLGGTNQGTLWRSSDNGQTWTTVGAVSGQWHDVKWKPGDPNTVYAFKGNVFNSNVKVSTDDGLTWAKLGNPPLIGGTQKSKMAVTADDPNVIYAAYGNGTNVATLLKTTDGGATWFDTGASNLPTGQGWYNFTCAADPNNADVVHIGLVSLRRSTDGGSTFGPINGLHVDHHVAEWQTDDILWMGNDGGMYRSDQGEGASGTFAYRSGNLATYQFYDICVNNGPDPYYVLGGTQDNGTDKWSGTTTWANGLGADGMVCNINPVNGTAVYAEIQFGEHYRSLSSGDVGTFSLIMNGITLGTNGQWVVPTAQDQQAGGHLYTNHSVDGIFRTTNGGNPWTNVSAHTANWIDISPVNGNIVWTVKGSEVHLSTDDGGSWAITPAYPFTTTGAKKVLAHPTDSFSAFVTFTGYSSDARVALTTDLGQTWADVSGDLPAQPINAIAVNPSATDHWFVGTDVGVWASINGGVNWIPYEVGLPNTVVEDLEIKDSLQKLVAGTHGRGAWEVDITTPLSTDASELAVSTGPINLMLDPAWPNPISDRTLLRYAAKHEGTVTLRIYDVSGRLVSHLGEFAGDGVIRTTPWYTADVPSGVYFAVLQAGPDRRSQKLIVRK